MWGINPVVIAQILGSVALKEIASGNHGALKIIRDKIIVQAANNNIAMAKAMARSVAQQDLDLYNQLMRELRDKLPEEEWQQIFSG
jgi:ABC-type uncharacterized transport system substrate-binding protein